ncbi:MAG: GFA family protein [Parvularculaceae bacterium]|nr:GFA family protein [Parvularculaceae bacterium]
MSKQPNISLRADAEGGCLCGAVRYRVSAGDIAESGYCHCRTCQRQSGAPVVAWFAVPPERVLATKGSPSVFRASDRAGREFCSRCGTYLFFREDDPAATLSVNTATLDDPAGVPPAFHIYHESRIGWFETADRLPRHARGRS